MPAKTFLRTAQLATLLTFAVVMLGAFVRLSDAGLGCPDWPVCYGHLAWPTAEEHIEVANENFPHRPVEVHKAWKEQVHRFLAASLGVLVLLLAVMASYRRPARLALIAITAASAAAGTLLYILGRVELASGFSIVSLLLPLFAVWRWRDDARARLATGLLGLVIFQAMLGMWTVTLLVKPIIVTAHLFGGLATLALLWLLVLQSRNSSKPPLANQRLPLYALLALLVLLGQIFLGAWTSTNYAALACPDFPTCQQQWWPQTNFAEAFTLWRGLGVNYEYGVLENTERLTIHLSHRIGAIVTALTVLLLLVLPLLREAAPPLKRLGLLALSALALQIGLGISAVLFYLPLHVAVAHNGGAALLLLVLVTINYALWRKPPEAVEGT
ncbi:MAG: COX15/CtaA family protein [Nevskiales bacterium]